MPAFPAPFGIGGFGTEGPNEFYQLMKELQGEDGYTDDDTSVRMREVRGEAMHAAIMATEIERASEQTWPNRATEQLAEWEQELGLRNNAARTVQERQIRTKACRKATSRESDIEAAIVLLGAASADLKINTATHVSKDDAEPDCIWQRAVEIPSAALDDPNIREAAIDVARLALPARSRGHLDANDPRDVIVEKVGARWNTDKLDRSALQQQTGTQRDHVRPPSRLKSYGPLSTLKAADFNAIQDALLWGVMPGSECATAALAGGVWTTFSCDVVNTDYYILDDIDWRDRFAIVAVRWSTSDIRPGQSGDTGFGSANELIELAYWGTGGITSGYQLELETDLNMYADSSTGKLRIGNFTGSTQYIAGIVVGTEDLGER